MQSYSVSQNYACFVLAYDLLVPSVPSPCGRFVSEPTTHGLGLVASRNLKANTFVGVAPMGSFAVYDSQQEVQDDMVLDGVPRYIVCDFVGLTRLVGDWRSITLRRCGVPNTRPF